MELNFHKSHNSQVTIQFFPVLPQDSSINSLPAQDTIKK